MRTLTVCVVTALVACALAAGTRADSGQSAAAAPANLAPASGPAAASALERAVGAARISKGQSNMHQIGIAIEMYRSGHKNQYPADLGVLASGGLVDSPALFVDPSDKTPQARGTDGTRYSYEYPGVLPGDIPATFIILYLRKGILPDMRNVLYADMSVQLLTEEQLHKEAGARGYSLQQQYDWLMEKHGKELTDAQKAALKKFYEVDQPAAAGAQSPLDRARAESLKANSKSNMHMIGLAIMVYRNAHGDNFPPDLETVAKGGMLTDKHVFADPSDVPGQVRGADGIPISYVYAGQLPKDAPSAFIVLATRKGIYLDGRIVLYVDNSVQFLTEEQLRKDGGRGYSLKQQYDWLMEKHGKELTDAQKAAFKKFYEVDQPATPAPPVRAAQAPKPLSAAERAELQRRTATVHAHFPDLIAALNDFKAATGRYPTTAEGLQVLPRQMYLMHAVFPDPWDHPYVYKQPGQHNPDSFDLYSLGPDGQDGTADDIGNWAPK